MTDTSLTSANLNSFSNYTAPNQGDAWAYLSSILSYYGLSSLDDTAKSWVVQGLSNDQVVQAIRQTDAYKTTFEPIIARQQAGLPPISEDDVINLRSQYAQIDAQMGAPQGFNGKEDYDAYITNDMSPTEYQDRWIKGYQAASTADPATKAALQSMYGVTDGTMAAFFLDPEKTEQSTLNQLAAAQIGGASSNSGYGNVTKSQAEYLQSLGVTQSQAQTGFGDLASKSQLLTPLPGQAGTGISQDQQFGAEFANNGADQNAIKDVADQRVNEFQGGGQFTNPNSKTGTSGIGVAQ